MLTGIWTVAILMGLAISPHLGFTEEKKPVKWEVTISVTYNAVTEEEAAKIVTAAMKTHETACRAKVAVTKVDAENEFLTLSNYVINPNGTVSLGR